MALSLSLGSTLLAALSATLPLHSPPPTAFPFAGPQSGAGPLLESQGWRPSTQRELELLDRHGNFHVAVVGEEIITRVDLFTWIGSPRFEDPTVDQPGLSPRERQALQISAALQQLIEQRLKVQGGRAQGYEEQLIDAEMDRIFRERIEFMGGPEAANRAFTGMGITPEGFRDLLGEGLMANLWERSITGQMPGSSGRVFVDSYVRPGQQWARYREYVESRDDDLNAVVGLAREGKMSLQQIVLLVPPGGKPPERVREEVQTLRDNILKGVLTFDEGIARFAPPEFRGDKSVVRNAPPDQLARLLARDFSGQADEVIAYVEGAEAGTISQVLEFTTAGQIQAYVLLKVLDRSAASEALPFVSFELQQRLRANITDEATEVRIARGLSELVRSTHLAPAKLREEFLKSGRRLRKR